MPSFNTYLLRVYLLYTIINKKRILNLKSLSYTPKQSQHLN